MRIFVAGATGVIGRRLIPLLVSAGHEVTGMTRSPGKANQIAELGAEVIVCDVFDVQRLTSVISNFQPEIVWHQLTDLPDDPALIPNFSKANNRIRREGTANLLNASRAVGSPQFIAQSVAWQLPGDGGKAVLDLENAVTSTGGIVIRYGQLYGPGTYYESEPPAIFGP